MATDHLLASSIVLLALLSLLLPLRLLSGRSNKSPWKLPPGPPKLPVIGNLDQILTKPLLHQTFWKLSKTYGPIIYLKLGQVPTVVISSADLAKQVLKTHDLACSSRPHTTSTAKLSYGRSDVVFAPYGDQWRELRKVCVAELFTAKKIALFRPIREEEVWRCVEAIGSPASKSATIVNLSAMLMSLISNITCRTAFGNCHDREGDQRARFHHLLNETQALFVEFFMEDYFPALGWVDKMRGMQARLQDVFLELDAFYQQLIDKHLDPKGQSLEAGEDTVDALLRVQRNGPNTVTDDHIKGVLMNIFVAGSDTSSSALEWAMTELMRHPEQMKRAQAEVRGRVGNKGKVEETDLYQLDYLKCVVKETMRFHPPVPLLVSRETLQHITLNGYDIPPKTRIYINAWAISKDPSSWERPDEFDPERFLSQEREDDEFKLLPFGEGRRICPAKNSGTLMVELVLANLLYSFDWGLPDGLAEREDIDMGEAPGITVHRSSPLLLAASRYTETRMSETDRGSNVTNSLISLNN